MSGTQSLLSDAVEAAISAAITIDARADVDPSAAIVVTGLYKALAGQLEPILGAAGVRAIYGRSVHLAASKAPWMAAAAEVQPGMAPIDVLHGCLAAHDPLAATEGGRILLVAFVELLARLIGEGLTTRLMAQAWPRAFEDTGGSPDSRGQKE